MPPQDTTKPRREKGTGAISRRKDGRWVAVFELPPREGKRRRKTRVCRSRSEARTVLADWRRALDEGLILDERITLRQFAAIWLATDLPARQLRVESEILLRGDLRRHLLPALGDLALAEITPERVQRFASRQLETLVPDTVRRQVGLLKRILQRAEDWGRLRRNPVTRVTVPRRGTGPRPVLTLAEAERLRTVASGTRWEALILVTILTGIRKGEALGLLWSDIDWDNGLLTVQRQLKHRSGIGAVLVDYVKSRAGRRIIPLPPVAVAALHGWKSLQAQERLLAQHRWREHGLVWPSTVGTGWRGSAHQAGWKRLLVAAGLSPDLHWHDLRHTHASLLADLGTNPRIVADVLGHSSTRLTLDVYTSPSTVATRGALERLAGALGGDRTTDRTTRATPRAGNGGMTPNGA